MRLGAVICCVAALSPGFAVGEMVDWTNVTLLGSGTQADPFTFEHGDLGLVTIVYSGNYKDEGIVTNWGSTSLLGLGETGVGSGVVTISWERAITSLNIRAYDLDLGERDVFTLGAGTQIELVSDNPLAGGDGLNGTTLTGASNEIPNSAPNNYAEVRIFGSGFTTFSVDFARPGSSSGAHALNFGDAVPNPASVFALVPAAALWRRRR